MAESVSPPGWITLARAVPARDRKGRQHILSTIRIRARSYIPDVYVQLETDVLEEALYDDEIFIGCVLKALRALGYQGSTFDRAELGLQGRDCVVLEPGPDFRTFVAQLYGWHDLSSPSSSLDGPGRAAGDCPNGPTGA